VTKLCGILTSGPLELWDVMVSVDVWVSGSSGAFYPPGRSLKAQKFLLKIVVIIGDMGKVDIKQT
jgi:hypothetical protein